MDLSKVAGLEGDQLQKLTGFNTEQLANLSALESIKVADLDGGQQRRVAKLNDEQMPNLSVLDLSKTANFE